MATATTDVLVSPADGWTLIAAAPAGIILKPHSTARAWFMAIADALPAKTVIGLPMGRFSASGEDNHFRSDEALTGNVYVRVPATSVASAEASDNKLMFSVALTSA